MTKSSNALVAEWKQIKQDSFYASQICSIMQSSTVELRLFKLEGDSFGIVLILLNIYHTHTEVSTSTYI